MDKVASRVKVLDRWFELDLSLEVIQERLAFMAAEIRSKYAKDDELVLLPVMNGALPFMAELLKHMSGPLQMHAINCKSYEGMTSSGKVIVSLGIEKIAIQGKKVIVVEDIVDTGLTLHTLMPALEAMEPSDLKIATLLYKPEAMLYEIEPDFVGFEVPTKFYVGYGLDYDGFGRELQGLYTVVEVQEDE